MKRSSNDRRAQYSRGGFTLIELIVVMGIIIVLAAMIFAGVSKARGKASSAKCAANLRVYMGAINMWLENNGGRFPRGMNVVRDIVIPYSGLQWDQSDPNNPPFPLACPSATWPGVRSNGRPNMGSAGYATNPCLIPPHVISEGRGQPRPRPPWKPDEFVYLGRITRLSEIVMWSDAGQTGNGGSVPNMCQWFGEYNEMWHSRSVHAARADEVVPFNVPNRGIGQWDRFPKGETLMKPRHAGSAMAVFLDGHVEPVRWGTLLQRNVHTMY